MIKYLHIGCGANILPKPFKNLDIRKKKGVDFVGAAYPLKFKSNSFDLVYASHVLEHFKKKDTLKVLKDWVRVLKPGGTIRISVPCIDNLIKIYKYDNEIENVLGPILGGQTYKENFHYNLFNKENLTEYLKLSDCEAIHPWDYKRTIHSKFWDFSQATTKEIPISLNLEARKKTKFYSEVLSEDIAEFKNQLNFYKKKISRKEFKKII